MGIPLAHYNHPTSSSNFGFEQALSAWFASLLAYLAFTSIAVHMYIHMSSLALFWNANLRAVSVNRQLVHT